MAVERTYKTIKWVLKGHIKNNVNSLWIWEEDNFTCIYNEYAGNERIYTSNQLLKTFNTMIYLNLIIGFVLLIAFIMIFMSIVEGKIRDRQNEKIVWRIEEMDKIEKRDKVVTRTGGLAHDRNRSYSEIQKQNDSKTQ